MNRELPIDAPRYFGQQLIDADELLQRERPEYDDPRARARVADILYGGKDYATCNT